MASGWYQNIPQNSIIASEYPQELLQDRRRFFRFLSKVYSNFEFHVTGEPSEVPENHLIIQKTQSG